VEAGEVSGVEGQVVDGGISVEEMEDLHSRQPGNDGARPVQRAESAHYVFNGPPGGSLQKELCQLLGKVFQIKAQRNCSAETISDILHLLSGLPCVDAAIRANMPTSFKAMLTALRTFGFPKQDLWEYAMCPCGEFYRFVTQVKHSVLVWPQAECPWIHMPMLLLSILCSRRSWAIAIMCCPLTSPEDKVTL